MLYYNNLAREDKLLGLFVILDLPVANNLPLVEVRAHVHLIVLEVLHGVDSAQWRKWPIFRGLEISHYLLLERIFADVQIGVVFRVVEEDVVVVDDILSFLPILEARVDEEAYSLSRWVGHQLKLLALSVVHGDALGVLEEVAGVDVHQLDGHSVLHLDPVHVLDQLIVVLLVDDDSSLQSLLLAPLNLELIHILYCLFSFEHVVLLLLQSCLPFALQFPHCVVGQLGHDLEDHVS